MIGSCQAAKPPVPSGRAIEFSDNSFTVDAALIGELLHLPEQHVPMLMREGRITSACERGVNEHEGEFQLTFFHRNRRARVSTDRTGRVLRRSVIDFGDRPIPNTLRSGG